MERNFEDRGTGQRFKVTDADGKWTVRRFEGGPEPYLTIAECDTEQEVVDLLDSQGCEEVA